jgi:pimeloyl-ACP methyl ester carboxylesterase
MHYLEWGNRGRNILALHSMMMDAHSFDFMAQSLSSSDKILAIDLLGHGGSEKPVVEVSIEKHTDIIRSVAESRKFSNLVLVGHSVGGFISIIYASRYPREVSRVILVDIAPRDPAVKRVMAEIPKSFRSKDETSRYLKNRYPNFARESIENRLAYGFMTDVNGQFTWRADLQSADMVRKSFTNYDFWPHIKRISAPALLIKGGKSEVVSDNTIHLMKRKMKDFSVITLKEAGHQVPLDSPKEFGNAVREFARSGT